VQARDTTVAGVGEGAPRPLCDADSPVLDGVTPMVRGVGDLFATLDAGACCGDIISAEGRD